MTHRFVIRAYIMIALMIYAASIIGAADLPDVLPRPDGKAPDTKKKVKVYFLSGQSKTIEAFFGE